MSLAGAEKKAPGTQSAGPLLKRTLFGATDSVLHQFGRYLIVGGLAFAVDFTSLYAFTEFAGLYYLVSAAIAFLLGLAVNYLLSLVWVFDRRTSGSAMIEFLIFAAVGVVGLGLNELIIWGGQERLHLHYMAAKLVSSGLVLIWNFGVRKYLLFR